MKMYYLKREFHNFKNNPHKTIKNFLKDNFKNYYYKRYKREMKENIPNYFHSALEYRFFKEKKNEEKKLFKRWKREKTKYVEIS